MRKWVKRYRAEGRLIARFTPASNQTPDDTAALRISSFAFDWIVAAFAKIEKASRQYFQEGRLSNFEAKSIPVSVIGDAGVG